MPEDDCHPTAPPVEPCPDAQRPANAGLRPGRSIPQSTFPRAPRQVSLPQNDRQASAPQSDKRDGTPPDPRQNAILQNTQWGNAPQQGPQRATPQNTGWQDDGSAYPRPDRPTNGFAAQGPAAPSAAAPSRPANTGWVSGSGQGTLYRQQGSSFAPTAPRRPRFGR